jgi:hypothetical protein
VSGDPAPGSPEWRARVLEHAPDIFVRELVDGRWRTVALSELPAERREEWLTRWTAEGRAAP